jgi:hypothetical protein
LPSAVGIDARRHAERVGPERYTAVLNELPDGVFVKVGG